MLLQDGDAGCSLVACGHFSPLQFSPNPRFNLLSTPETHRTMRKNMVEAVVQWKEQENYKIEPPLSLSRIHRLSDNQKIT